MKQPKEIPLLNNITMKISHFVLIIFTFFYFTISCKENLNQNNTNISNIINDKNITTTKGSNQQKDSLNINFLDKKYQINSYFIPDYSPSFPSYTYSDNNIGVFSVNYIGKKVQTQQYWDVNNKKGYFSKYQNVEKAANLSDDIKKLINIDDYYVIASYTPQKHISYIDESHDEFELKPNATTYFYLYTNNTWKLIYKMYSNKIPIENMLKFQTSIIQKGIFKNNSNLSNKYDGNHKIVVETSIPSAEMARSKYSFTINHHNVNLSLVTYLEQPICDGKYFANEVNNTLEMYYVGDELSCVSVSPKFIIKKENNLFYLKILESREGIQDWLLMN